MKTSGRTSFALLCVLGLGAGLAAAQEKVKGGGDETGPYELVRGWPDEKAVCGDHQFGSTAGIWAQSPDRVFIFQRGCLPIIKPTTGAGGGPGGGGGGTAFTEGSMVPVRNASGYDMSQEEKERQPRWDHNLYVVDRNGKMVESWEQHNARFVRPHRVLISPYDPEKHVWLIDDGAQMVYKFTNDGKTLVKSWGEFKVAGTDDKHFARPTDIAWLPDGSFFVSDGYVNTRVVKFDKDGKYVLAWGEKGTPPNEKRPSFFNTVHAIAIDKDRRVYVADRANSRIQIFDENGKFIEQWPNVRRPYSVLLDENQNFWVADGTTQKFTKFNQAGELLYSWGTFGAFPGGFWGVHQFSVDSEGNLYTADVHVGRPQKFRPKKGANPAHLIGKYWPVAK
jgi:peptidylamidoglycolate lyase